MTQDCVFVSFFFSGTVYFCTTLPLTPMCVCHAFVWRTSRGRLCSLCCASVSGNPALCCVHGLPGSREWGLEATSAHVAFRALRRICEPTRDRPRGPCDSWGPLRQLRPTAHSDSVIMGGLLLRFTVTHPGAHTHTPTPKARSQAASSLGAVQPGHSRGHLPFREGG